MRIAVFEKKKKLVDAGPSKPRESLQLLTYFQPVVTRAPTAAAAGQQHEITSCHSDRIAFWQVRCLLVQEDTAKQHASVFSTRKQINTGSTTPNPARPLHFCLKTCAHDETSVTRGFGSSSRQSRLFIHIEIWHIAKRSI